MIPAWVTLFLALLGVLFGIFIGCMFEAQLLGRWDAWKVDRASIVRRQRDEALDRADAAEAAVRRLVLFHEPDQTVWVDGEEVTVTEPRHIAAHPHWRFGSPIRPAKGRAKRGG
jgi:hypothetical protein